MRLLLYVLGFLKITCLSGAFQCTKLSQHVIASCGNGTRLREGYRIYGSLFDPEDIRAMNPPAPLPPPKKPAIYIMDDALAKYRYHNFKEGDSETRHFGSLPYVELRYQDKGALARYRSIADIVSTYANKVNTLLSNFQEWTAVFNPEGTGVEDLSLYNPLSSGSYYAVVFYCAWQSESIALKRAIHQLCGRYSFDRDPPFNRGPKPQEKLEDIIARINEVEERHQQMIAEAREKGLPDPPAPPLVEREQAVMKMRSVNSELTSKILDYLHDHYNYRWWMSRPGRLKYNKVLSKAYAELHSTSYKRVVSDVSRHSYKLSNRALLPPPAKWYLGDNQKVPANFNRMNFILVRLANSMMLSNSKHGLRRMRNLMNAHAKEMHFNEMMMELLIQNGTLYKDMPLIQLFRCVKPVEQIPPVFNSKRHELRKFDLYTPFYKPDPFAISRDTLYGLPPLRKCSHLAVPEDFEYMGSIMNLDQLTTLPSMDNLLPKDDERLALDFNMTFRKNTKIKEGLVEEMKKLEPFLTTMELMYKMNFKQIVDARPVPVVYKYLNP